MLYFDEAGYTGPDLTNNKQPYFALASIRMTDNEVVRMKKDILVPAGRNRNLLIICRYGYFSFHPFG